MRERNGRRKLLQVMQLKRILFAGLLCLLGSAWGQQKIVLDFGDRHVRDVFIADEPLDALPAHPQRTEAATFELPTASATPKKWVYVWDQTSGNLASKRLSEIKGRWAVEQKFYNRIARLTVRVEHAGKPVAAALVQISDGQRQQDQLIDPGSKGEATFVAVKPGSVKITVKYRGKNGPADPMRQMFEVGLDRKTPEPVLICSLPEGGAVAETPAPVRPPSAPAPKTSSTGQAILYILVLVLAGTGGYYAWKYLKENPEKLEPHLKKLGVPLDPEPDDLAAAVPPPPATPEPQPQILLGDAPAAATTAPRQPRLIRDNGEIFALEEGMSAVGREAGLPISLENESTVSRNHAQIVKEGETVRVRDLGSTNGTYINGKKLDDEAELHPGDAVQFGSVRLRYEV